MNNAKLTRDEALQKIAELTTENVYLRGEVATARKQPQWPDVIRSVEPEQPAYRPRDYVLRSVRYPEWR